MPTTVRVVAVRRRGRLFTWRPGPPTTESSYSPIPLFRPKLHSIPPPGDITPETCFPSSRSSDGDQGTRLKPRPSSIMAKRPDARFSLWR